MPLLADLIVEQKPARAQSLLEAQPDNIWAARKLAEFEMAGRFGIVRPDRAVRAIAHFPRLPQRDYDLMMQAARQHNAIGEDIPVFPRQATLNEIGGGKLLAAAQKQDLDSVRGVVRARALVDPAGTILYTEVPNPEISRFRMASATLDFFAPSQLSSVGSLIRDGRPMFHWLNIPAIHWASPPDTSTIGIRADDLK